MNIQETGEHTVSTLPTASRRRLALVAIGWGLAALIEALAYVVVALSVLHGWAPWAVLATAAVSVSVTMVCARAGYLSGARMAGELYGAVGTALRAAKLAWFTADNRAVVDRAAGAAIPSLMGVPAHQLQTLVMAPLVPVLLVIGICCIFGPVPGIVVAVLLVIALAAQVASQRRLAAADGQRGEIETEATAATLELVEHLDLLRTASGPERAMARTERIWLRQEAAMSRTNRAAAPATLVSLLASVLPIAGTITFLVLTGGVADPAAALALTLLAWRAGAPLDELALAGLMINDLRSGTAAYRAVTTAPRLAVLAEAHETAPRDNSLELDRVSVLHAGFEASITVPEGGRMHITGSSGIGKSTLLGLLMRCDDPDGGRILLGGVPLTSLTSDELARRIAYVPQDAVVFSGTIADNIRVGRANATDDEVTAVARAVGLGRVLQRDRRGIDQDIGRHGASLSGGERQRLAIARALVKNAPILLLDEATSALDGETEHRVADVIRALPATVIFVTHRDPAIWRPDLTLALDDGGRG